MKKIGSFLVVSLFYSFFAFAEVKVSADVQPKSVALGENLTVTVTVSSGEEFQAQEPRLPDLDGLDLLNSWDQTAVSQKLVSTPSGMQFETSRRREFNYVFSPKAIGNLNIGAFEVVVNGTSYSTKPLTVQVTKESSRPQRPQGNDPFEDMLSAEEEMFKQLLQSRNQLLRQAMPQVQGDTTMANPAFRSMPRNPNEAFFIQVEVDKTEVYEGEQVTVNWYVYTRGQMETLDRLKFPSLKGFWKEIIEEVPTIQFVEEIVNGVPYRKALLASHALFPIKPGTAVIDEFKIKSRIRAINPGFGGGFGKAYEYTKSSETVPIKVKPLPLEGRTQNFTGAVGAFEVNAQIEGQGQHPVNQPFTLRVRFEGTGNAKTIDLPKIELPPGVEVYDTKSESRFFKNGRSYKQFDVLILPRQLGALTIPPMAVNMFDPSTGKYYTKETLPLMLQIVDNPNAPVGSSNRVAAKKKDKEPEAPLAFPEIYVSAEQAQLGGAMGLQLWLVVYGLTFAAMFAGSAKVFEWFKPKKTLRTQLQRRFKNAEAAVAKGDHRHVGTEMMNAFYLVLGKVSEEGASLSVEKLLDMAPPSVRREYGPRINKSFEYFQTLGFAPEEMLKEMTQKDVMKEQVKSAISLLNEIFKD